MRNLIIAAILVTAGCAPTRPVHYYTLAPVSPPVFQLNPAGPTMLVGIILTPEFLQDDRIHFRAGSNEAGSYEYHRWVARPGAVVGESLVRALRGSGRYRRVMEAYSSSAGDYLLRGRLYEFDEVDNPAIQTKISLHLVLIDAKTNRDVWSHPFEREEPASGKTIEEVVRSMDRNLQQVVKEAVAEIDRFVTERSSTPAAGF